MLRHDRTRFIAYALPCFVNGIALALYALDITTSGTSESGFFPALIMMVVCLIASIPFSIKRGRDINLPAAVTCVLLFVLGPLAIAFIVCLIFMKSSPNAEKEYGPAPPKAGGNVWMNSVNLIFMPWVMVMIGRFIGF